MGKRHPNPRLVKIHRSNSVEEIAGLFGVHKNTVRAWLKQGLEPIDKSRPVLVHGKTLAAFLTARRAASKRPCPPRHFYCMRCRAPKPPAENYVPLTDRTGNLSAICPTCSGMMCRRVSKVRLAAFSGKSEATFAKAPPRIREQSKPSLNRDLDEE